MSLPGQMDACFIDIAGKMYNNLPPKAGFEKRKNTLLSSRDAPLVSYSFLGMNPVPFFQGKKNLVPRLTAAGSDRSLWYLK